MLKQQIVPCFCLFFFGLNYGGALDKTQGLKYFDQPSATPEIGLTTFNDKHIMNT